MISYQELLKKIVMFLCDDSSELMFNVILVLLVYFFILKNLHILFYHAMQIVLYGWLVSWVHGNYEKRHVKNFSIWGSNGCSPSDLVHESLVSSFFWKRWLVEDSYGYGEVDKFSTIFKICFSWEVEINVLATYKT